MPRLARKCPPGLPVHVIQRGNNRQLCFASDSDLKACANWLLEASVRFSVSIHAWVFMTNHVHLLMTPSCWSGISRVRAFDINVRMWTPHPEYRALGTTRASRLVAYRNLFTCELDGEAINEIRNAANTGLVLGNDCFRKEVERLTGQRQHHLKRGPKPKSKPNEEFLL